MPGKVKVRILAGRNLPVMDRAADTTDAYVEVKLGNVTHKTDVFRKSLNPSWNSEWFRFEVDDHDLQDEPLQIRLMDHDTYSANDAIGKVYVDLNPLLLPPPLPVVGAGAMSSKHVSLVLSSSNTAASEAPVLPPPQPAVASLTPQTSGPAVMSGWLPVYDTMHGLRGEVAVVLKVDLFSDFNRFRQSSCGVHFFFSPEIPATFTCQRVVGLVEELVKNHDPEYEWIDKIRSPRASNEAKQTLFCKLSGMMQRKIGLKVLDMGGNAVLGYRVDHGVVLLVLSQLEQTIMSHFRYRQCFDLEGESGIVVRGLGTAVVLVPAAALTISGTNQHHVHHSSATLTSSQVPAFIHHFHHHHPYGGCRQTTSSPQGAASLHHAQQPSSSRLSLCSLGPFCTLEDIPSSERVSLDGHAWGQMPRTRSFSQWCGNAAALNRNNHLRNAQSLSCVPFADGPTSEMCVFCVLEQQGYELNPNCQSFCSGMPPLNALERQVQNSRFDGLLQLEGGAHEDGKNSFPAPHAASSHVQSSVQTNRPRLAHKKLKSPRERRHNLVAGDAHPGVPKRSLDLSSAKQHQRSFLEVPRRLMKSLTSLSSTDRKSDLEPTQPSITFMELGAPNADSTIETMGKLTKATGLERRSIESSLSTPISEDNSKKPVLSQCKRRDDGIKLKFRGKEEPSLALIAEESAIVSPEEGKEKIDIRLRTDSLVPSSASIQNFDQATESPTSSVNADDDDDVKPSPNKRISCTSSGSHRSRSWRKRLGALRSKVKRRISLTPSIWLNLGRHVKKDEEAKTHSMISLRHRVRSISEPSIRIGNFTEEWFGDSDSMGSSESESGVSGSDSDVALADKIRGGIPSDLSYVMVADESEKLSLFEEYMKRNKRDFRYNFYLYDDFEDSEELSSDECPQESRLDYLGGKPKGREKSNSESSTATVLPSFLSDPAWRICTNNRSTIVPTRTESVTSIADLSDVNTNSTLFLNSYEPEESVTPIPDTSIHKETPVSELTDEVTISVLSTTPSSLPDITLDHSSCDVNVGAVAGVTSKAQVQEESLHLRDVPPAHDVTEALHFSDETSPVEEGAESINSTAIISTEARCV
ncbi:C2 domain [Trinorchestia longiramus]|nr:C2 domain [Trinorchestia longiramus]